MRSLVASILGLAAATWLAGCTGDDDSHTPTGPPVDDDEPQVQEATYWWNDQVFYEIFVRSFYDADGDGRGDLPGLIAQLDYLNDGDPLTETDLGVTALWLMPIAQSPSDHGYDTTDYRTVESDYGTNADFQQLVSEAHARGIRVITDFVMNHCSNQHPWFTASAANALAYRDWFAGRGDNPGWPQPWGGGQVWHYGGSRGYYYGVFWSGMPDLNYAEPAVEAEMFATADYWLQELGADGFRLDAVKYLAESGSQLEEAPATFAFWSRFRQHLDGAAPDAFLVGEAWDETSVAAQYVDAGLHTCFEFDLATALLATPGSGAPTGLANQVHEVVAAYPYHQYATFLANHDQRRALSQLGGITGRNRLAAAILLTLPGVPFLFYGEEVGMQSSWDHGDIRRPMQWTAGPNAGFTTGSPWTALGSNYATNNVATMQGDPGSLWRYYRTFVQARTGSVALRRGAYHRFDCTASQVYAFLRHDLDQAVVAVHNLSSGTVAGWTLGASRSQLAPGEYAASDLLSGAALGRLTVAADGAVANWRPVAYLTGFGTLLVELAPVRSADRR